MGYVLKAVLSSAQHPEYGQITVPFPIPDEKYDRMIELLEPLEIGDALRQDCRVDELDSFYTVLNRLVGSLVNFDELDYLAKRLDSFDDGEAAQFQGMACKLGVSNIKDFINLTFCCQQATVITDFSDLDAIGRQHYMTMQGGGCRIEELERLDGRKFALDLILNHLEGRITPYGVVYDIDDEDGIEQADEFAKRLAQIEREWPESDMVKYKALLSVVDHPSLQDATRLMGEIDQYELRPEVAQTWGYAEMMFREKYSALPEELFQTPQAAQIGQKMLDDRLGVITEYGLIRRKDGQPLPVFQPEQEIGQGLEMM